MAPLPPPPLGVPVSFIKKTEKRKILIFTAFCCIVAFKVTIFMAPKQTLSRVGMKSVCCLYLWDGSIDIKTVLKGLGHMLSNRANVFVLIRVDGMNPLQQLK